MFIPLFFVLFILFLSLLPPPKPPTPPTIKVESIIEGPSRRVGWGRGGVGGSGGGWGSEVVSARGAGYVLF